MERWCGKVAVVTGASAGIGASIVKALAKNNLQVVGLARRQERVQEIADQMKNENGKVYAVKADITKEEDIKVAFEWIKKNLGGVDILINNAGILLKTMVKDGEHDKWKTMFDLNVLAMASCTRETLNSIKERGLDDGHIININSISGHRLTPRSGGVVYSSTKFAAKVLTEGLRLELANAKSKIRVTNISPGVVTDTEIFLGSGGYELYPDQLGVEALKPNDIANAVVYALSQPPTVLGKIGDQGKTWGLHMVCTRCSVYLREWLKGTRKDLPIGVPVVWHEPKDHVAEIIVRPTGEGM